MSDLTDIMREYAKSAYVTAPLLFLPSTASALPHPENQCVDRDISLLVGAVGGLVGATVVSLLRDNYNSSGNYRKGINASLYFTGTLAGVTACLLWSIK
ncbi:TPA: hypothetical protein HA234_03470 [Candidatus Woesearchaeota archaeon]|nr:hypothetical protein [Candidatus Woesearchaeota archaeon]